MRRVCMFFLTALFLAGCGSTSTNNQGVAPAPPSQNLAAASDAAIAAPKADTVPVAPEVEDSSLPIPAPRTLGIIPNIYPGASAVMLAPSSGDTPAPLKAWQVKISEDETMKALLFVSTGDASIAKNLLLSYSLADEGVVNVDNVLFISSLASTPHADFGLFKVAVSKLSDLPIPGE